MRHTPIVWLALFTLFVVLWAQFSQVGVAAPTLQTTTTPGTDTTASAPAATNPPTVVATPATPTPLTAIPFPEDNTALILLSVVMVVALGGALLFSLRGRT